MRRAAYSDPTEHISISSSHDVGLNLLTSAGDQANDIMNVDTAYTWVQVPCAVDSGACAHVAPPGVFGKHSPGDKITKGQYYAADRSPIDGLGQQTINAVRDGGHRVRSII